MIQRQELVHICSKFVKSPSFAKVTIGTSEVDISTAAKNLGVVFDKSLNMKDHVKNLVRAAPFAIYRIGRLRRYLDHPSVARLVHAFVSSRLDSCNALLYCLQEKETAKLQRSKTQQPNKLLGVRNMITLCPLSGNFTGYSCISVSGIKSPCLHSNPCTVWLLDTSPNLLRSASHQGPWDRPQSCFCVPLRSLKQCSTMKGHLL